MRDYRDAKAMAQALRDNLKSKPRCRGQGDCIYNSAKQLGVEPLNARCSDHSCAARRRVTVMLAQMQRQGHRGKAACKAGRLQRWSQSQSTVKPRKST
jgi:hypothetical protein